MSLSFYYEIGCTRLLEALILGQFSRSEGTLEYLITVGVFGTC
jgi:hypothetical protein